MFNIAFFGPPGAGKGTQCKIISQEYGFVQISTGDLIRNEVENDTGLGKNLSEIMNTGGFPSDELVCELFEKKFADTENCNGRLLDGFPRTLPQANALVALLARRSSQIDLVFSIDINNDILEKRILGRYMCANCGAIYNEYYAPSNREGICDICHSEKFTKRDDDRKDVIKNRLRQYTQLTAPVISFFEDRVDVAHIDGTQPPDAVSAAMRSCIDGRLSIKKVASES